MKLARVAQYFNDTQFSDAYTGAALGVGQLDLFDDATRDGVTVSRRIFEVAPGTPRAARSAIRFHGADWLVGAETFDAFRGEVIRLKRVLHRAEGLAQITTLRQTLEGATGLEAYGVRVWLKTSSEVDIDSDKVNQLQIFFARGEPVAPAMLIALAGRLHIVLETYDSAAGFLTALAEELEAGAIETGSIVSAAWDPITETQTAENTPTPLVRLRWQADFAYHSQMTEDFERGDLQVACLVQPANGTVLRLVDGPWQVLSSQPRDDVIYLHLRRTGA